MKIQSIENTLATVGKQMGGGSIAIPKSYKRWTPNKSLKELMLNQNDDSN